MHLKMRPSLILVERPGNPVKPSTIGSTSLGGIDDGSRESHYPGIPAV